MKIKIQRTPDNIDDVFIIDTEKEGIQEIKSGIVSRHNKSKIIIAKKKK